MGVPGRIGYPGYQYHQLSEPVDSIHGTGSYRISSTFNRIDWYGIPGYPDGMYYEEDHWFLYIHD